MANNNLDKSFWSKCYQEGLTGWDIGYVSTPIKKYIDQLEDKNIRVLIPGAGNAYEAEYLHRNGFNNVWLVDLAEEPLSNFRKRNPEFPTDQIHNIDFFDLEGTFDLIIEQTFFCALLPGQRKKYVKKCHDLLSDNGKLVGLLFNMDFNRERPPFGGNVEEYQKLFSPFFEIKMELAYNSIKPREGSELFIRFRKKQS